MHIFIRSIWEIIKTFLTGIVSSVIFALMIYSELAISDAFVCLVLNSAALFMFLYIHFINWSRLYEESSISAEYFIPTLSSFAIYAAVSSYFYSKRFSLYMWLFLPTRFLEPKLPVQYAPLSVVVAHILFFLLIFLSPVFYERRRQPHTYRQADLFQKIIFHIRS